MKHKYVLNNFTHMGVRDEDVLDCSSRIDIKVLEMRSNKILKGFKKEYKDLVKYGLVINGIVRVVKETHDNPDDRLQIGFGQFVDRIDPAHFHYIDLQIPFVFDRRKIPKSFQGFEVRYNIRSSTFPPEFNVDEEEQVTVEEANHPKRYVLFVKRCADEIREKLGDPKMSKEEMLDALNWCGDFRKYLLEIYKAPEEKRNYLRELGLEPSEY
jgi:hypothetical protein